MTEWKRELKNRKLVERRPCIFKSNILLGGKARFQNEASEML